MMRIRRASGLLRSGGRGAICIYIMGSDTVSHDGCCLVLPGLFSHFASVSACRIGMPPSWIWRGTVARLVVGRLGWGEVGGFPMDEARVPIHMLFHFVIDRCLGFQSGVMMRQY